MQQHFRVLYLCPASFVTRRTHHIFGWSFLYAGAICGTSFPCPWPELHFLHFFLLPEDRNNTGRFTGMQPTSRKVNPALILCLCSGLSHFGSANDCPACHMPDKVTAVIRCFQQLSVHCPVAHSPHTSGYMTRLTESAFGTNVVHLCRTQLLLTTIRRAIHRIRSAGSCGI